jgi:hypothetical protein
LANETLEDLNSIMKSYFQKMSEFKVAFEKMKEADLERLNKAGLGEAL